VAELQLNVNQAVVTEPVKVEQYPVKERWNYNEKN